jgi:hypothetical protein
MEARQKGKRAARDKEEGKPGQGMQGKIKWLGKGTKEVNTHNGHGGEEGGKGMERKGWKKKKKKNINFKISFFSKVLRSLIESLGQKN